MIVPLDLHQTGKPFLHRIITPHATPSIHHGSTQLFQCRLRPFLVPSANTSPHPLPIKPGLLAPRPLHPRFPSTQFPISSIPRPPPLLSFPRQPGVASIGSLTSNGGGHGLGPLTPISGYAGHVPGLLAGNRFGGTWQARSHSRVGASEQPLLCYDINHNNPMSVVRSWRSEQTVLAFLLCCRSQLIEHYSMCSWHE
jgi:hypothetical protein